MTIRELMNELDKGYGLEEDIIVTIQDGNKKYDLESIVTIESIAHNYLEFNLCLKEIKSQAQNQDQAKAQQDFDYLLKEYGAVFSKDLNYTEIREEISAIAYKIYPAYKNGNDKLKIVLTLLDRAFYEMGKLNDKAEDGF